MPGSVKPSGLYFSLCVCQRSTDTCVQNIVQDDSTDYITFFPQLYIPVPMAFYHWKSVFVTRSISHNCIMVNRQLNQYTIIFDVCKWLSLLTVHKPRYIFFTLNGQNIFSLSLHLAIWYTLGTKDGAIVLFTQLPCNSTRCWIYGCFYFEIWVPEVNQNLALLLSLTAAVNHSECVSPVSWITTYCES